LYITILGIGIYIIIHITDATIHLFGVLEDGFATVSLSTLFDIIE